LKQVAAVSGLFFAGFWAIAMRFGGDFTGRPSEMVSNAITKVGAG